MKKNSNERLASIVSDMKSLMSRSVKIGLPSDVGHYPDSGKSILEVGANHEFGLGVPRRSFIALTMDKEKSKINSRVAKEYESVILQSVDPSVALGRIGLDVEGMVKSTFKSQGFGEWEELSEETREAKGSDKILFDTGRLVQSITHWVEKK